MQLWKHRDRKSLKQNYLLFWVNKDRDSNSLPESLSDVSEEIIFSFFRVIDVGMTYSSPEETFVIYSRVIKIMFAVAVNWRWDERWANFPAAPLHQSVSILYFIFCNTQ